MPVPERLWRSSERPNVDSDGVWTFLAGPDADHPIDVSNPDLAITDLVGSCCTGDDVDDRVGLFVVDDDRHADLRDEVNLVLGTAICLGVAPLTEVSKLSSASSDKPKDA